MLSDYFGVADILQSDYYVFSGFGEANYLRVKNADTDVSFYLTYTDTGEMVQLDTLAEETTYRDLCWTLWSDS